MIEPTRAPAGIPPAAAPYVPQRTVLAGIAVLRTRAGLPAQSIDAVELAPDGRRATVTASIGELSAWYSASAPRSAVVGGRDETGPNGLTRPSGGLRWVLSYGQIPGCPGVMLSVVAETTASGSLPDTPLVRALHPRGLGVAA
ncbi:hypothetical protein ACGFZP_05325 [Kitasatospora sp. NPDC048239]|uniref:hypothetical protein n=1 Tax=Kitasatospora sp. NPDC048239 TaxID=3364046 RepID=UPI00372402F8